MKMSLNIQPPGCLSLELNINICNTVYSVNLKILRGHLCTTFNKKKIHTKSWQNVFICTILGSAMSLSPLRPISSLYLLRITLLPPSLSGSPLVPRPCCVFYSAKRLFGSLFLSIRALHYVDFHRSHPLLQ